MQTFTAVNRRCTSSKRHENQQIRFVLTTYCLITRSLILSLLNSFVMEWPWKISKAAGRRNTQTNSLEIAWTQEIFKELLRRKDLKEKSITIKNSKMFTPKQNWKEITLLILWNQHTKSGMRTITWSTSEKSRVRRRPSRTTERTRTTSRPTRSRALTWHRVVPGYWVTSTRSSGANTGRPTISPTFRDHMRKHSSRGSNCQSTWKEDKRIRWIRCTKYSAAEKTN